ncbi:FixH family protein [Mesorhizobium sp. M0563]|uniref:FixH family protein n=1 Tax=Mesorhizobium sp. M0563 TaxID=2956959 RepID=UPI00333D46AE
MSTGNTENVGTKQEPRRAHRPHIPALILAFFATIIVVDLTMAVLASCSWTGFVVKNSMTPARNSIARRMRAGHRRRSDGAAPCDRKWRDPLPPEGPKRQDAQAGGVKRTMMTSLAVANAVMMSTASSLGANAY